jgi:hypothetical protein
LHPRVFGLETEYVLNFIPSHPAAQPPTRETVYEALIAAVGDARPTARAKLRKIATALSNGGFLQYEAQMPAHREGMIEAASPECRSPRDVAVWSAAQDRVIAEAIPEAERVLATQGHFGQIVLGKNNLGYEGHAVGSHENYWVEDRCSWWRAALRLVLFPPFLVLQCGFWILLWSVLLVVVVGLFAAVCASAVFSVGTRIPLVRRGAIPIGDAFARRLRGLETGLEELLLKLIAFCVYRLYRPFVQFYSAFYDFAAFSGIRRGLTAHLVSRTVFAGAGSLALDSVGCPAGFLLSQRADRLVRVSGIYWDEPGRPFIDTKQYFFQPFALFARRKRLHIICGDSNMSETAEWLRFGTTDLVLRLAEAGKLADAPILRDPVGAMRTVARDPSLHVEVEVLGRGRMTALALQHYFLERAAREFGQEGGETAEVIRTWRQVLERLERDPASARGQVDWVCKRELMLHGSGGESGFADLMRLRPVRALIGAELDTAPDGCDGRTLRDVVCAGRHFEAIDRIEAIVAENFRDWDELARAQAAAWRMRKADLRYHQLDAKGGYYYRLRTAGETARVASDGEIFHAMSFPPEGTRAAVRGRVVHRMHSAGWDGSVSWSKAKIPDAKRTLHFGGPLNANLGALDSLPAVGTEAAATALPPGPGPAPAPEASPEASPSDSIPPSQG